MKPVLRKKRIGVIMGGSSAEREISLKSGKAVVNALQGLGYSVQGIEITSEKKSGTEAETCAGFIYCPPSRICEVLKEEMIEAVFLALHGGYGENGGIQGLMEVMGLLYTGSGILASALAMDKEASKKIFLYHGIPVPPFVVMTRDNTVESSVSGESGNLRNLLLTGFEMPWVVKPATEGSSMGVSIVRDETAASSSIEEALRFGDRVVIERHVQGKEIQTGILNDKILGSVEVRTSAEFYNYEAKYTAGLTEYILPPEMDSGVLARAEKTALSAHKALGCKGATRVDLIVDTQGNPYVLEVNTIPGMTETSLLPKIARLSGMDFPALAEELLVAAIRNAGKE